MKSVKRFLLLALMAIVLLPVLSQEACASTANIDERVLNVRGSSVAAYSSYQQKDNTSAVYLKITSFTDVHTYVSVYGVLDDGTRSLNLTMAGSTVGNVVCRTGVNYSVHNGVYENGYRKVQLGFQRLIPTAGTANMDIRWSPDSAGSYNDATRVGDNTDIVKN